MCFTNILCIVNLFDIYNILDILDNLDIQAIKFIQTYLDFSFNICKSNSFYDPIF